MIRKVLIYPALLIFAFIGAMTIYYLSGDKATAMPDISVKNTHLRLPAPGQNIASAYFDIINKGGADELLSATSVVSPRVELHTHLQENGMMKMRKVSSVKIMGEDTTQFKSGGLHVMLFDISIPPNTKSIPLTLNFARTGEKRIIVIIDEPSMDPEKMNHEMMDHENMNHEGMEH